MDPDANWQEQEEIRAWIAKGGYYKSELREKKERLRELEEALNEWMSKGGFAPEGWHR